MNQPLKASSSQQSAMGGPLPILLDFRNGGRGWRMSLGALVQATLLGLVLVLPLLVTDSIKSIAPEVHPPPIRLGNLAGNVDAPRPDGPRPVKDRLNPDQVYLPVPHPHGSIPVNTAGISGPVIGNGSGLGDSPFGHPDGDPFSNSPVGQPAVNLPTQPPPPPADPVLKGGDVRRPRLIHRVEPEYPRLARLAGIQGDVVLEALLDKDGRVRNVEIKSGHPSLAPAAQEAVGQWIYEPTYLNGQPYAVLLTVTVEFRLKR